jgi:hypothetical protein
MTIRSAYWIIVDVVLRIYNSANLIELSQVNGGTVRLPQLLVQYIGENPGSSVCDNTATWWGNEYVSNRLLNTNTLNWPVSRAAYRAMAILWPITVLPFTSRMGKPPHGAAVQTQGQCTFVKAPCRKRVAQQLNENKHHIIDCKYTTVAANAIKFCTCAIRQDGFRTV